MKIVFQIPLASTLMFGAVSCGQHEEAQVEEEVIVEEEKVESIEEVATLRMNGDQPWEVNREMKEYPLNCKKMIQKFQEENRSDYNSLGEQLGVQLNKMVSTCTMKGESHEVLHVWLEPVMNSVEKLKHIEDPDMAAKLVDDLQASFDEYTRYFR